MLSKDLETTLNEAFRVAKDKRHEFMTVEHLLLALLDNTIAVDVLKKIGADLSKLRLDLDQYIDSTTPVIPQSDSERETQPTLDDPGWRMSRKETGPSKSWIPMGLNQGDKLRLTVSLGFLHDRAKMIAQCLLGQMLAMRAFPN